MSISRLFTLLSIVVFSTTATCIAAEMTEGVKVSASKIVERRGISRYSYSVENSTASSIAMVEMGFNYLNGSSELTTLPYRAKPGKKPSATIVRSPKNWTPNIVTTEESEVFSIVWQIKKDKLPLSAGATLAGFQVRIKGDDAAYLNGHWRVSLTDGTVRIGTFQAQ